MRRRVPIAAGSEERPKRHKKPTPPNPITGRRVEMSPEEAARTVERRKAIAEMLRRHIPKVRIAEQLGVSVDTVIITANKIFEEYRLENAPHVAAHVAELIASHRHLLSVLFLEAHGGAYIDEFGNRVVVKRVPEATHAYQRTARDLGTLLGGKGAVINIGSIDVASQVNAQVNTQLNVEMSVPDEATANRLVRERFASARSFQPRIESAVDVDVDRLEPATKEAANDDRVA